MQYNAHNLAVAKLASKQGHRGEALQSVFFTDKKTVATDSYRLLEVAVPTTPEREEAEMAGCKPFLVKAEHVAKLTTKVHNVTIEHLDDTTVTFNTDGQQIKMARVDDEFPQYESIFPKEEPKLTVKVNAKYLREVLAIMEKMEDNVYISVYGKNEPIVISTDPLAKQQARAMLMPVTY